MSDDHLVAHNLIVAAGTVSAGLFGVAFQSLVSHQLSPSDYGAVFVVVTLITLIGLPAGAFTLLMAREASRSRASGLNAASAALLHGGNRALLAVGVVIASAIVLGSPFLSSFLAIPSGLLLAAAVGIPFALAFPLLLGELQGRQRFSVFAGLLAGQAAGKLVAAIALGFLWGPVGVVAGISAASIVVYAIARLLLHSQISIKPNLAWWPASAAYLAIVLPSSLALALLLSADVLLVKHYFPSESSGQYSAMAALGRAIFWGAAGVASVLFPKVILRAALGLTTAPVVTASLLLVGMSGLMGWSLLSVGANVLLGAFAGAAYVGAAQYLPLYAVGMTLLGGIAVLTAAHQSKSESGFLWIMVPLAVLEPALIVTFHHTLLEVVVVVDISMAMILVALGVALVIRERARRDSPAASLPEMVSSRMDPQLEAAP